MRSAARSHEKPRPSETPATSTAIHSTPEPTKPKKPWLERPSPRPSTPPAWLPATSAS